LLCPADPPSLLTHFADLANPIAVGWLTLRVERWKREARYSDAVSDAEESQDVVGTPQARSAAQQAVGAMEWVDLVLGRVRLAGAMLPPRVRSALD
jgi:hypothetical protein